MSEEPIRTDRSNVFAWSTTTKRIPEIVRNVLQTNPQFSQHVKEALEQLASEIEDGRPLPRLSIPSPESVERHDYSTYALGRQGWHDMQWFFSEAFVYHAILQITGYFEVSSENFGRDPFWPQKRRELMRHDTWLFVQQALAIPDEVDAEQDKKADGGKGGVGEESWEETRTQAILTGLFTKCVWGNKADLCYAAVHNTLRHVEGEKKEEDPLVVNEARLAITHLIHHARTRSRVDISLVVDNSGVELLMDLVLVDSLLHKQILPGGAEVVITMHIKLHPTFVSDTTPGDLETTILLLSTHTSEKLRELGNRLQSAIDSSRLIIRPHAFWNGTKFFLNPLFPPELSRTLRQACLVILKGDANYRRVLQDTMWDTTRSLSDTASEFPLGPDGMLLCLRGLKSDPIVGVPRDLANTLDRTDNTWRNNGKRAIIQVAVAKNSKLTAKL